MINIGRLNSLSLLGTIMPHEALICGARLPARPAFHDAREELCFNGVSIAFLAFFHPDLRHIKKLFRHDSRNLHADPFRAILEYLLSVFDAAQRIAGVFDERPRIEIFNTRIGMILQNIS